MVLGFLCWEFLVTNSTSLLVCSDSLFIHDSVLVGCIYLGIYPFWGGDKFIKFVGTKLFKVVFHDPMYFCHICCNISSFIYDFSYLSLHSFFSCSNQLKLCPFCLSFQKNQIFVFLIYYLCGLYFTYFFSDLCYFFPSAKFGLSLLFF